MNKKLETFSIEIPHNNPEQMEKFQELMNHIQDENIKYIENLAEELGITVDCAMDVWYLRGRSRWTEEKEKELIRLHKAGNPPNVLAGDF